MARVLGVDLGERRIGLAASDPTGTLASPLRVLIRGDDPDADRAAIIAAGRELEVEAIVVGLPRSLSGREGPAARRARAEAEALATVAGGTPVVMHDERFTTRDASARLRASGRSSRQQRDEIDAAAAAVMLQSYLDGRR